MKNRVYEIQRQIIYEKKQLTVISFRSKWFYTGEKIRRILDEFQKHNDKMKLLVESEKMARATLERYDTAFTHVKNFVIDKFQVDDLDIRDLNLEFVEEFDFWLKTKRKCNHNTTIKYIGQLRKIVNHCIENGWLQRDPFIGFKMSMDEVSREYLTESEIEAIKNKKFFSNRVTRVRDIFIFCCYTGLAYADVKKLKPIDISIGIDGEKWLHIKRQKTDTPSAVPLLKPALDILEKYKEDPECLNKETVLPVSSNQKMNEYLKEIAELCGVKKNLTSHIARFTFGTTITLGNGVPIETVSKMLGHKSLEQTQHYAKVLNLKISRDMNELRQKYFRKDDSNYEVPPIAVS